MKSENPKERYYLFKGGQLHGPVHHAKLEQLKASGEILRYSWMMNESDQVWTPVESMPQENPFQVTQKTLNCKDFSAAFLFGNQPFLGAVKGIHSFGLELLLSHKNSKIVGLKPDTVLQLNLADETLDQAINTEVVFQGSEEQEQGFLLRFAWVHGPAHL